MYFGLEKIVKEKTRERNRGCMEERLGQFRFGAKRWLFRASFGYKGFYFFLTNTKRKWIPTKIAIANFTQKVIIIFKLYYI